MTSNIPIPVDNLYKFLALFGLVAMVSSMTLMVYLYQTTNETVWKNANEIFTLEASQDSRKEDRVKLLNREIEIAVENRDLGKWLLAAVFGAGFFCSLQGFWRWHKKIQPVHDEILELQKTKLELEIQALNNARHGDR